MSVKSGSHWGLVSAVKVVVSGIICFVIVVQSLSCV